MTSSSHTLRRPTSKPKAWVNRWRRALLNQARSPTIGKRALADAKRAFRKELTDKEQMELVQEAIATRMQEWTLAYPEIVSVMGGTGRKTTPKGQRRSRPVPCIVFIVKKKWGNGQEPANAETRRMPSHVFTHATIKRNRVLCAIPTDIEDAEDIGKAELQGSNSVVLCGQKNEPDLKAGNLTAFVKKSRNGPIFGLSCRHVLQKLDRNTADDFVKSEVRLTPFGETVATSRRERGKIVPISRGHSFDAQLMLVRKNWVNDLREHALFGVSSPRVAANWNEVPEYFDILLPENKFVDRRWRQDMQTLRVQRSSIMANHIIYYTNVGDIAHNTLLVANPLNGKTQKGDSGSPAFSRERGLFIGMHIAKAKNGVSCYLIPAWELIKPCNYRLGESHKKWKIVAI